MRRSKYLVDIKAEGAASTHSVVSSVSWHFLPSLTVKGVFIVKQEYIGSWVVVSQTETARINKNICFPLLRQACVTVKLIQLVDIYMYIDYIKNSVEPL